MGLTTPKKALFAQQGKECFPWVGIKGPNLSMLIRGSQRFTEVEPLKVRENQEFLDRIRLIETM